MSIDELLSGIFDKIGDFYESYEGYILIGAVVFALWVLWWVIF